MNVLLYDILYITACIYECSYMTVAVTLCIEMISVCIFTCRNFCYLLLKVLKLLYGRKPVEGRGYGGEETLFICLVFCIIFKGISCPNEMPEFFYTFCIYLYTICEYCYQI